MKILSIIVFVLFLGSCQKELIYPSDEYPIKKTSNVIKPSITIWGEFIVIDAIMYVENHETHEKFVFNHFSSDKSHSSLRWGGSIFNIEEIVKDSTTYSFYRPIGFPGYGKFILNNDTSQHYAVYYVGDNKSIIEDPIRPQSLIGGSSRPFSGQTDIYKDSIIAIQIQETEGSINGYNCKYWTQLKLKKIKSW